MKAWQYENENENGYELCVDAYGFLTRRQFISKLREIEGISIKRSLILSFRGEFCRFEYRGEVFSVEEENFGYTYSVKPKSYNSESLNILEKYFVNLDVPKAKTRPVFWFAGIVLIGLAIYANISGS